MSSRRDAGGRARSSRTATAHQYWISSPSGKASVKFFSVTAARDPEAGTNGSKDDCRLMAIWLYQTPTQSLESSGFVAPFTFMLTSVLRCCTFPAEPSARQQNRPLVVQVSFQGTNVTAWLWILKTVQDEYY